jgi:hypothetical protein
MSNETASRWVAITANDTTDFPTCRALYISGGGTLVVNWLGGPSGGTSFTNVQAGTVLPIAASRVYTTSTATVIALY